MDTKPLLLRGVVKREGDYWASIVLDFNIVGTGNSPEDAVALSMWMTKAYIEEGCAAGKTLKNMRRPAAMSVKATYYVTSILSRVFPGRERHAREDTMPFVQTVLVPCTA